MYFDCTEISHMLQQWYWKIDQLHCECWWCLLHAFTLAYILYMNDSCTCPYSSPHTAISEMQMHIFTPTQALTSSDAHSMHTHTHPHIWGFVNGRHVSFYGNRDRQILYALGNLFYVWVSECAYRQFIRIPVWQSPRDRLQAWHLFDNHCRYFYTIQMQIVSLNMIVF